MSSSPVPPSATLCFREPASCRPEKAARCKRRRHRLCRRALTTVTPGAAARRVARLTVCHPVLPPVRPAATPTTPMPRAMVERVAGCRRRKTSRRRRPACSRSKVQVCRRTQRACKWLALLLHSCLTPRLCSLVPGEGSGQHIVDVPHTGLPSNNGAHTMSVKDARLKDEYTNSVQAIRDFIDSSKLMQYMSGGCWTTWSACMHACMFA
eukprot:353375-Chlamydomonas_euryale.AAC.14